MTNVFGQLGTRRFLGDLRTVQSVLETLKVPAAELEVTAILSEQIGDLIDITISFDDVATMERRKPSVHARPHSAGGLLHLESVVRSTAAVIGECTLFIQILQSTIEAVTRASSETLYTTTETYLENQGRYEEVYEDLQLRAEVLRALFTAKDLLYHGQDASHSLETRSSVSTQLHYQIGLVEQRIGSKDYKGTDAVHSAVRAARAVTVYIPPFPNKHFVIVRPVKPYFTSRERQLAKLDEAFRNVTLSRQLRFVIYGLSGSGKTELAFKFADEHRHSFWGVFFVDGSSRNNASSSYAEIATLGGVEPNERAAKNWLATRDLPWLLIIDNVDREEINVEELLPPGSKDCVLITTRNPALMTDGNVGDRYIELMPLEPHDAEILIIKAAEEPRPTIKRIRRELHRRGRNQSKERKREDDDSSSLSVFSTYEILYESLESSTKEKYKDAVELLHIFSFFHFQNIRLDTLISSATNLVKEEQQRRDDDQKQAELCMKLSKPPRKPWIMFLRELRAFLNSKIATPTPLPNVLRNRDGLNLCDLEEDIGVRLGHALGVLIERSLVAKQDRTTGRYSMHRLIHEWVRERPEMSTAHQALWCEVSMTTLAMSIRQPPQGDSEGENEARRELLPHIRHVVKHHALLKKRLKGKADEANLLWRPRNSYGRMQAEQDVRFSRVYAETGNLKEARELQERALAYVSERLGAGHPLAIWLSLYLTKTLWELSEMDHATLKQRQARRLCITTWGEVHPLTLDVTELLGSALNFKGRWGEAISLNSLANK
ncbi:hypothetical protein F5Y03DRAFT_407018 [Xylaria venustula]|nr:hypothetical protein F5Y03DRAFT_407018 [Xylaria venustula]